jgi:hypothetical protein
MSRQHVSSRETHHEKTEEFFKYDKYDKDELLLLRLLLLASIVDAVEGMIQEIVDLDDSLLLCDFEGMIHDMAFLAHVCALLRVSVCQKRPSMCQKRLSETPAMPRTNTREREEGKERDHPPTCTKGSRDQKGGHVAAEDWSGITLLPMHQCQKRPSIWTKKT